jgi:hypothetical protein
MRSTIVAAVTGMAVLLVAGPALADQNNIDRAVNQAIKDYKASGESAMSDRAKVCYDGVDYRRGVTGAASAVEYCMSYEFAACMILSKRGEWDVNAGYFNVRDVMFRAAQYTEKARVVTLPEQFDPYWKPRSEYIKKAVAGRL